MKHRVPSDVDRLMWLVAESNDPKAIADFESRFAEFGPELARRRRMVSELKGAKSHVSIDHRIPAFKPRVDAPTPIPKGMWIVAGIAFASLAFASYSVFRVNSTQGPIPKPEQVVTQPVETPDTNVYRPVETPPITDPIVKNPPPSVHPTPSTSGQEMPKSLKLSNTSLIAALKMIGEMAGYRVEVAPGFQDQQISIDYDQITTSEMLKDLGLRYSFTPFDQGDGTIIIVPAVDAAGGSDTNGSQRRIGG